MISQGVKDILKDRTAIITGSTSGIGLGIAETLAAASATVMLNGFGDAVRIEEIRRNLAERHGVRVAYSGADLSKPAEVRLMVEQTAAELGAVDILVNNAGIQHVAPIGEFPDDKWDAILAINLWRPSTRSRRWCLGCRNGAGAGSSISPRHTVWSPAQARPPMSRQSTASSA